jgi:hypothetical protein
MLIALNFFSRLATLQLDGAWQLRMSSEHRPMAAFAFEMRLMPNEAIVLEKL